MRGALFSRPCAFTAKSPRAQAFTRLCAFASALVLLMSLLPCQPLAATSRPVSRRTARAVAEHPAQSHVSEHPAQAFDGGRAFEHVRRMVEAGPRPAGTEALARVRRYITSELKSYGLKVSTDEFAAATPVGRRRMANVTAELAGESAERIIVASHYDTKLYKDFRFVGANDGGSSTGALLELARVLAARTPKPRLTYQFVFFDGEEAFCREWDECGKPGAPDNTYGSRHLVEQMRRRGELSSLRAMILLDMIGYRKLELGRDPSSSVRLLDLIWRTARELGYGAQFLEREESVGGDDHEPFLSAGVEAVDLIQLGSYPHWHTPEDTLDKISPQSLKIVGDVLLAALPRIEQSRAPRPAQSRAPSTHE